MILEEHQFGHKNRHHKKGTAVELSAGGAELLARRMGLFRRTLWLPCVRKLIMYPNCSPFVVLNLFSSNRFSDLC